MPSTIGPALLVVAAAISQEVGAAFAVGLFPATGAVGAVFVRLAVAGIVLGAAPFAALAGWAVLGQRLGATDYLAIVLVTAAAIGAVRTSRTAALVGPGLS